MKRASIGGKKCVIYCRTSTDKQETGLDTQYFDCRTQVSRIGLDLVTPSMEELTLEEDYTFLEYGHMPGGWFDEGLSGGLDPLERPSTCLGSQGLCPVCATVQPVQRLLKPGFMTIIPAWF